MRLRNSVSSASGTFIWGNGRIAFLSAVCALLRCVAIAPAEGDLAVRQCDQAMVGDGDAVRVAAEILEHVVGTSKGWFGVDDPVFAEERTEPGSEKLGMGERCEFSSKMQLAALEGRLQAGDELATKYASQY